MSWYVMHTAPGREEKAAELLKNKVDRRLWENCRILKKEQLFRIQGRYVLNKKELFPGYLFIETGTPERLAEELEKAKDFPQLIGESKWGVARIEEEDLRFLRNACGEKLEKDMGLSTVQIDGEGQVQKAIGILEGYLSNMVKQRLRQRYVIAKVPLFNRVEDVLFGIRLEEDEVGSEEFVTGINKKG